MSRDEEDDLYNEEFDFVDEEDDDLDAGEPADERDIAAAEDGIVDDDDDEPVDQYGRPEPTANYVVHIYEHQKFKRTIDRPFTPEDAEAFATDYNQSAKSYGRVAVPGKNDSKPKKALD